MDGGSVTIAHAALPGVRREVVKVNMAALQALGAVCEGTPPLRAPVRPTEVSSCRSVRRGDTSTEVSNGEEEKAAVARYRKILEAFW